jgi:hypothetical protein
MAAHNSMLGRKQEQTIPALLTQRNLDEAAKAAGISMRTLMRWLKRSRVPGSLSGSPPDGIFPSGRQAPAGSHGCRHDPA